MKVFATMATIGVVCMSAGCAPLSQGVSQTGSTVAPSVGALGSPTPTIGAAGMSGTTTVTAPVAGQASTLSDVLMQKLGVSPQQAAGGAGSIFSAAKQVMSPTDFAHVSEAVPGMDNYLAAAPQTTGLIGAAGSALGGSGSTVGKMASLAGSFQSLGLDSSMVSQFIPIILQYVQTNSSSATMSLLKNAVAL